ncbi:putative inorganic phosphate cotransporter isoform X3 [Diaphorina citri]|uniref:Sialin n=1 Tax=Diaphorina citri TaxID=121845 RepID=A0A1S4EDR5_DIACI|nr:putative inorganic phosphate cotransporter isoform X3 [Diaphorina citri]
MPRKVPNVYSISDRERNDLTPVNPVIDIFTPEKSSSGCISQRYILGFMGFLAVANAYAMRGCLSLAITEMVVVHHKGPVKIDPNGCPGDLDSRNHTNPDNEFDWDEKTQGLILSAFYWGYVIMHIPGGLLAQKFGGKHTLGFGILSTAIFTLLTPFAARQSANWLIALRFFEGLGEGTTFPALNTLLAQWVPPTERGKIGSFVFAGNQIGTVFSSFLSGFLLKYTDGDWPEIFYLFGILGVLWFVAWCFLCYNDPASHPYISQREKEYLADTIGCLARNKNLAPTPWRQMATSVPLIGLVLAQIGHDWIGHDWGLFMISADLPKYMKSVMKFSIAKNGVLSSLPFLLMWLTAIVAGWFSDYLVSKNIFSVTVIRKIFTTIASVGPASGVILASYAGCDQILVVTLFTVGMAFMGFFYPSLKVNALDLSPNYAGTLMAIVNGIGAISGIISPYLIGILVPNSTMLEWRLVFWISFGVIMITNVAYVFMGSGKIQSWNEPRHLLPEESVTWQAKNRAKENDL